MSKPSEQEQRHVDPGYCHCGCGQKTSIAKKTNARDSAVKGQPVRYIVGHAGVKQRSPVCEFTLRPGTRAIPLTQDKVAIVDDADYERLSKHRWFAYQSGQLWYARRNRYRPDGKRVVVQMHREILDADLGTEVDHKNGDGLDNRRENLRPATPSQNRFNTGARSDNKSGFKGVSWHKAGKWVANIQVNGKQRHLGLFTDIEEAACAYDTAARELHGDFARLNFGVVGSWL